MWAEDFSPAGFGWIDANDSAGNVVSFLRYAGPGADGAGLDGAGAGGAGADGTGTGGAGAGGAGAGGAGGGTRRHDRPPTTARAKKRSDTRHVPSVLSMGRREWWNIVM
jgi:hypothetical protein